MKAGWRERKLGEVLKLEYGKPLPPEFRSGDAPYPAFGANGVLCFSSKFLCAKAGIVVGRKGSAGELTLTDGKFWPLDVTYFVTFDEREYDLKFLFYCLKSLELPRLAKGVKPGLNRNEVYALRFSFPPLPDQKRIVTILDEAFAGIDAAIVNTKKNIENARELFDASLSRLFSDNALRWACSPLGDLIDIKHGFAFDGKYFSNNGKYVLLTPGNFYETGGYRDRGDKQKYYTGEIPDGYTLKYGDFLFAMTEQAAGLLGSAIIVPESDRFLHNQRLGLAIPKPGRPWSSAFFFYLAKTRAFRDAAHRSASGVKVRHTSPTKLREIEVSYPPTILEQEKLAAELDEIGSESVALQSVYVQRLEALTALKQSILHRAFTAELTDSQSRLLEAAAE